MISGTLQITDAWTWLESGGKCKCSEFGKRVASILDRVYRGIYHADHNALFAADWSSDRYIVVWHNGELATYDLDLLTRLVYYAHEYSVRVAISAHGPRRIKLEFHPRKRDGKRMFERHPSIDEAVNTLHIETRGLRSEDEVPA